MVNQNDSTNIKEVHITKCSNSGYWYSKHVGDNLPLHSIDRNGDYWCREQDEYGALNFVLKQDGILMEPTCSMYQPIDVS